MFLTVFLYKYFRYRFVSVLHFPMLHVVLIYYNLLLLVLLQSYKQQLKISIWQLCFYLTVTCMRSGAWILWATEYIFDYAGFLSLGEIKRKNINNFAKHGWPLSHTNTHEESNTSTPVKTKLNSNSRTHICHSLNSQVSKKAANKYVENLDEKKNAPVPQHNIIKNVANKRIKFLLRAR